MLISIPTFTFDSDNYHVRTVDRTKCTAKIANNNITTESLKYIFNNTKIGESKTRENMKYYIGKYKGNVSRMYNQRRYNKFMKSNASYRKMQRKYKVTNAIVELVDIFPTIADLAGVPIPMCQINNREHKLSNLTYQKESDLCSEGITLLPLIKSFLKYQVRCSDLRYTPNDSTKIMYKIKDIILIFAKI